MICTGQQTLMKNVPRFIAPRASCMHISASSPTPILLRRWEGPIKLTTPTLRMTSPMFTAYPSFRLMGHSETNTLVGSSILRAIVNRHFSTTKNPEENDGATKTASAKKVSTTPVEPRRIYAPNKEIIAKVDWSHILFKVADQYILDVVCSSSFAYYSLEIPLDAEEISMAMDGPASLDALAAKIRRSPSLYWQRRVYLSQTSNSDG